MEIRGFEPLSYCPVFDNSRTCLLLKGHRERKKADTV